MVRTFGKTIEAWRKKNEKLCFVTCETRVYTCVCTTTVFLHIFSSPEVCALGKKNCTRLARLSDNLKLIIFWRSFFFFFLVQTKSLSFSTFGRNGSPRRFSYAVRWKSVARRRARDSRKTHQTWSIGRRKR